jgi:hypothetical protein
MGRLIAELRAQRWHCLHGDLACLEHGQCPGVYLLAYSDQDLEGQPIDLQDVLYVGMSNSQGGVKRRVGSFVRALDGKKARHVAGKRFRSEYLGGRPYSQVADRKRFYVSWVTVPCEAGKPERTPADLRAMGDVAALEYYVLAHIREEFGREPRLNRR